MKVRYASPTWSRRLDAKLPLIGNITVFHLGRGGMNEDGTLDAYNRTRVEQTLATARTVKLLRPHASVQIVWTGGCNRQQDRDGAPRLSSEGGAALRHARTLLQKGEQFTMLAEEDSTSTVENATASAKLVHEDDTIVVVTDPLHYTMWKVQNIFWLAYPEHQRVYVELLASPPGTNWKKVATHLVSTCTTIIGMLLVNRGNAADIQRRQVLLQKCTRH